MSFAAMQVAKIDIVNNISDVIKAIGIIKFHQPFPTQLLKAKAT
jgi:hypothetical protein